MRTLLIAVAIALAGVGAAAQQPQTLEGLYYCHGSNADGKEYDAMLQLIEHDSVIYARWIYPQGPPTVGVGFIRDGVLMIGYHGGVVAYPLEHGEIHEGQWVVAGTSHVHREKVTKMPAGHPDVRPQRAPVLPEDFRGL
jgi:hypothetical protein